MIETETCGVLECNRGLARVWCPMGLRVFECVACELPDGKVVCIWGMQTACFSDQHAEQL